MRHSIIFLGTPDFALPILERLHQEHHVLAVITQPDKPVGRKQTLTPPPVKDLAEKLGLKVFQPIKTSDIPSLLFKFSILHFEFLITAAYGEYLPQAVLNLPQKDALNIHPSLLPKYRGATPIQSALLNGDTKTGVSIIRMVQEMDAGPIFDQEEITIDPQTKYPELSKQCAQMGAELISQVLTKYDSIHPQNQDNAGVISCHKISKADGQINWNQKNAAQIYNKLRAFTPWPGVYTFWNNQKLNLIDFIPHLDFNSKHPPGTVFQEETKTFIQTPSGCLELKVIQLASKTPININDFLNGNHSLIDTQL